MGKKKIGHRKAFVERWREIASRITIENDMTDFPVSPEVIKAVTDNSNITIPIKLS